VPKCIAVEMQQMCQTLFVNDKHY